MSCVAKDREGKEGIENEKLTEKLGKFEMQATVNLSAHFDVSHSGLIYSSEMWSPKSRLKHVGI